MPICEYCGNEHDGSYGSGRFCSASCRAKYADSHISKETRQIRANTAAETRKRHLKELSTPDKFQKAPSNKRTGYIGKTGELKVAAQFLKHSIPVYLPISETEETDMIADIGGNLKRIQVKTSTSAHGHNNDATDFKLSSTNFHVRDGKVVTNYHKYSTESVDYFALCDIPHDRLYLVKNDMDKRSITIRQNPAPFNDQSSQNLAKDYDFDYRIELLKSGVDPDTIIDGAYTEIE